MGVKQKFKFLDLLMFDIDNCMTCDNCIVRASCDIYPKNEHTCKILANLSDKYWAAKHTQEIFRGIQQRWGEKILENMNFSLLKYYSIINNKPICWNHHGMDG